MILFEINDVMKLMMLPAMRNSRVRKKDRGKKSDKSERADMARRLKLRNAVDERVRRILSSCAVACFTNLCDTRKSLASSYIMK